MLQVRDLSYERGGRLLFSGLGFELESGQILHIKGENGSGKSSLIKLLAGIRRPDTGSVIWKNSDISTNADHYHASLVYIGHKSGVSLQLNAEQNLDWYASISGASFTGEELEHAFKYWGLYGFEDIAARNLSAGQRRRIALCRLVLENKTVWLLDEPLVSLDFTGVESFTVILKKHLDNGGMVILSSHQDLSLPGLEMRTLSLNDFKSGEAG